LLARILIADDHAMLRKTLKLLLESHADWKVCDEAENGLEAVEKAAELKPDLIIMDLAMPVMDGLSAARKISASFPQIAIVVHSHYAFPSLVSEAEEIGVRQFVRKGDSPDELFAAVEAVLKQKTQAVRAAGDAT